jgi:hypothetical protein
MIGHYHLGEHNGKVGYYECDLEPCTFPSRVETAQVKAEVASAPAGTRCPQCRYVCVVCGGEPSDCPEHDDVGAEIIPCKGHAKGTEGP